VANEKVTELLKDKSFVGELVKADDFEAAQKLFKGKGVDITIDEMKALRAKTKQNAGEELSDEELALVAGGYWDDELDDFLSDLDQGKRW